MDDLSRFCCLNTACPDHGKRGHGNLTVPARHGPHKTRRLLRCSTCKSRFSERKGTPLFDARLPADVAPASLGLPELALGIGTAGRPSRSAWLFDDGTPAPSTNVSNAAPDLNSRSARRWACGYSGPRN
jgi:hypothetical protein